MPDPVFLSGEAVPDYLKGVELMTAGMEWKSMNGSCTITMEHLADAVRAYRDPHIQPPRIKLGHTSPINGDHPNHDAFAEVGDAEPAFGIFRNLRLENDGAVLVGDADNVPAWLAEAALSAYPNRSAEGDWNVVGGATDVQTNGGQRYSFVCTAVSLLGVYLPAITDLEDLQTLIVSGPAALTESQAPVAAAADPGAAMSVSYDTIWERSIQWLREHKPEWPYSWTRDIRVDPDECIVDDDEGHIWALPFSTDGANTITYGPDLTPKAPPQFPDAKAPIAASRLVASFARPTKPSPNPAAAAASTQAASARPEPEGVNMDMDDDVREFLVAQGFDPETVTEVQINAARLLMAEQPEATGPETPETPETPEAKAGDTPEAESETPAPEPERVPVAASRQIPEGMSLIDSATLAELKAGATAGTQLAREKATETRDRVLSAARDEGRFPPARLAHYTRLYDADPEGTTVLLTASEDQGGLAKGAVPLEARAEVPDPGADPALNAPDLPDNVSLLAPHERAISTARRG